MKRAWLWWDWRLRPELPLTWGYPDQMIVLVDGVLPSSDVSPKQRTAWIDVVALCNTGGVVVVIERDPTVLATWPSGMPAGLVPALRVERQAGLRAGLDTLRSVKAGCRALVVEPACRFRLGEALDAVDLVVVRASQVAAARYAEQVRALRDECRRAKVAFAYPDEELDGERHLPEWPCRRGAP